MKNVYTVYSAAKHNLASTLSTHMSVVRLKKVAYTVVDPKVMATHLYGDNYRSVARVPGYYDPNSHTIYMNKKALPKISEKTAYIICYHELVHSISAHKVIKTAKFQSFQSGVKIEVFSKQGYRCFNRSLNEGMVQYLTIYHNNCQADSYGYAQEVKLVQQLANDLGHPVIESALTGGDCHAFKRRFEKQYGHQTFQRFSALMDRKRYSDALNILTK